MKKNKAFKDWFDGDAALALAEQVQSAWPAFDQERFYGLSTQGLSSLEFNQRVKQFSEALALCLPKSVPQALAILADSLPPVTQSEEPINGGWLQWPVGQFIAEQGLDHFEESFQAMTELTQRFTSEFAVRPFVERYPRQSFARLQVLTAHPNPHVRRWCSEGVRPLLPWGKKLKSLVEDPSPIWPILEALKTDPALYVRRSVANNLNDISKNHANLVLACCKQWSEADCQKRNWIVKHGLRTLIKKGHPKSLALLGFHAPRGLESEIRIEPAQIKIGESVLMTLTLASTSQKPQDLLVDYALDYVRQKGKVSHKVFKWTTLRLEPQSSLKLEKKHPMRETTVRALYPGLHRVSVQINGLPASEASFELL